MDLEKIISEGLVAFLPVYIAMKGNCSLLITLCESYEVDKTIKAMLVRLGKYYLVDIKSVRRYYGNILSIKNLIPIPFNKDNIFIPVRVRRPLCRNDGSLGYVNIKYIKKVSEINDQAIISLENDKTIKCLNSIETVNKHIKNGIIVKRLYENREKSFAVNENYAYGEYDKPATKGDVVLIINELLRLKETIK